MRLLLAILAALTLALLALALHLAAPAPPAPELDAGCPARLADCERRCDPAASAARVLRCLER